MHNVEKYFKELYKNNLNMLKESLETTELVYQTNPEGNKHLHNRIKELQAQIDIASEFDTSKTYGWEFNESIYYPDVSRKTFDKFMNSIIRVGNSKIDMRHYKEKEDEIILHVNRLAYFFREIEHLECTQRNQKKSRINPPVEEILKVLRYVGDEHVIVEPLLQILSDIGDIDISSLSYEQRLLYELLTPDEPITININLDKLKGLKNSYNDEIKLLQDTIKSIKKYRYKKVVEQILKKMQLHQHLKTRT